jgi:hypothetical protein
MKKEKEKARVKEESVDTRSTTEDDFFGSSDEEGFVEF